MNITQLKILELSVRKDIWSMKLQEIGKEIGVTNRGLVKYHLNVLLKKGKIKNTNSEKQLSSLLQKIKESTNKLVSLPILGYANCGTAVVFAEEKIQGHLKISKQLLPKGNVENYFVVQAVGDSMNNSNIGGENIEEGDYLIIDANKSASNGQYVLSIIDGCANIKKFHKDSEKITLFSESTQNFPPIYIHPQDNYLINGTVTKVIKNRNGGELYGK